MQRCPPQPITMLPGQRPRRAASIARWLAALAVAVATGPANVGQATAAPPRASAPPAAGSAAPAVVADTLLLGGKVLTGDAPYVVHEAIAVRDGKVLATGRSAALRALAGPQTRVVDLQGRTVIPGLVDSHMHAVRAALSFATEVNWIGAQSLDEALGRLRDAARTVPPGTWLVVAGGWTEQQFREKRRPTGAELAAAAPQHPVYVQWFYGAAVLSPLALQQLNIRDDADVPPRGKLERDAAGRLTGALSGDNPTITGLFSRLPTPSFDQKVAGTRLFFRELNRLALTGVVDPGGFNLAPPDYLPLFKVWQDRQLTVRVAYSLFAQKRGSELDDFKSITQMIPMGWGDGLLQFNGIGESVTWGMYNNDNPTDTDKAQFREAARWAAQRRMTLTAHWPNDRSVHHLLQVFEDVNRETPITGLRWSVAHLNDISPETMARMKALGVGWLMQDAMYFEGDRALAQRGEATVRRMPPIRTAIASGMAVGAGTDAHRVMSYNPFVALRWMLDGRTVGGTVTRGAEETPTREQALSLYTAGSAWFAHDEQRRGTLAPGRLADLAVLSADFLTVPVEEISRIESLLTMVGGRIVWSAGPYERLERLID